MAKIQTIVTSTSSLTRRRTPALVDIGAIRHELLELLGIPVNVLSTPRRYRTNSGQPYSPKQCRYEAGSTGLTIRPILEAIEPSNAPMHRRRQLPRSHDKARLRLIRYLAIISASRRPTERDVADFCRRAIRTRWLCLRLRHAWLTAHRRRSGPPLATRRRPAGADAASLGNPPRPVGHAIYPPVPATA